MLHHVDVHVRDLAAARRLFDALGDAIGYRLGAEGEWYLRYRPVEGERPRILFTTEGGTAGGASRLAFAVRDRHAVDAAASAAAAAGARAVEAPGLNPEYGEDCYAAFFDDADGNRYEIVADAEALRPPRIARLWRARVRRGQLRPYRRYIRETGLNDYRITEGNRGAWILSTESEDREEVATLSFWDSREAIVRFAGEPIERAQYYPEDDRYLLDRPETVEHFDIE